MAFRLLSRAACFAALFLLPSLAFASEARVLAAPPMLRTALVLVGVCALAAITLRLGGRRFGPQPSERMQVLERLAIEPRRSLVVVRIANRTMVLASSEAGLHPVTELDEVGARAFEASFSPTPSPPDVSRETLEVSL